MLRPLILLRLFRLDEFALSDGGLVVVAVGLGLLLDYYWVVLGLRRCCCCDGLHHGSCGW